MEGAQVKLPLLPLGGALREKELGDPAPLKALVEKGLVEMAQRHQIEAKFVLHLLDDVVDKVVEESRKWNAKVGYPPRTCNNLSISIEMPAKGKVGVVEYNQTVNV